MVEEFSGLINPTGGKYIEPIPFFRLHPTSLKPPLTFFLFELSLFKVTFGIWRAEMNTYLGCIVEFISWIHPEFTFDANSFDTACRSWEETHFNSTLSTFGMFQSFSEEKLRKSHTQIFQPFIAFKANFKLFLIEGWLFNIWFLIIHKRISIISILPRLIWHRSTYRATNFCQSISTW